MTSERLRFRASESSGEVSALFDRPAQARALLVFAHGAGAGMEHVFMQDLTDRLVGKELAVFRFNFPYKEAGKPRPDPPGRAIKTIVSAVECARSTAHDLPVFAGGKSFGGRMTSTAASQGVLIGVEGLVFFGFPLHSPAKPGSERAAHLFEVERSMLFLQGTRDALARLELLEPVLDRVGPKATLHLVEGANHGFHVPKRSGRTDEDVLDELADTAATWIDGVLEKGG